MPQSIRNIVKNSINHLLKPAGYEFVPSMRANRPQDDYLPFEFIITQAKKANMSVSDFVDIKYAGVGTTAATIETLVDLGVLSRAVRRITEIGPGSGRYLEKVQAICQPEYYEIYETAAPWRNYVVKTYGVVAQPCDYWTLSATPDDSIDLIHAHRVYTSIPSMISYGYMLEMARVVQPGGWVVFDAFTETTMEINTARKLIAQKIIHPHIFPRQLVIDAMTGQGLLLKHHFFIDLTPGTTEYFVFYKPAR